MNHCSGIGLKMFESKGSGRQLSHPREMHQQPKVFGELAIRDSMHPKP